MDGLALPSPFTVVSGANHAAAADGAETATAAAAAERADSDKSVTGIATAFTNSHAHT